MPSWPSMVAFMAEPQTLWMVAQPAVMDDGSSLFADVASPDDDVQAPAQEEDR